METTVLNRVNIELYRDNGKESGNFYRGCASGMA